MTNRDDDTTIQNTSDQTIILIVASIPYVKAILRHRIPRQDVEDVAQDVMHKMLRKCDQIRNYDALNGWAAAIAHSTANDYWRHRQRTDTETLPEFMDDIPCCRDVIAPDIKAENKERDAAMLAAIRTLPDHQQDAILFFYYEGMSVKEVADILEKPTGTIKRWLFLARQALREVLK